MKQLTLESLRCRDAEDLFGDECRLEVFCDGELQFVSRQRMADGDQWAVEASVLFAEHCNVRLFDEDFPFTGGADDRLGTIDVAPNEVASATASFIGDGADYTLTYSVVDRPDLDRTDLATFAADRFAEASAPGLWPSIAKADLVDNLRARRRDVLEIDQERSNFCGPTSIVYELARLQPQRYVELSRQLYETGGFWSRSKRIDAPPSLRHDDVGQKMDPADWMLIATMRNAENVLVGVKARARGLMSGLQGITHPWEIKEWAQQILLYDDVEVDTCFLFGKLDAMRAGHAAYEAGGSAFVLLNLAVLKDGERRVPPYPDHWVVYQGGLEIAGDRVRFDVYSWGRIISLDLSMKRFKRSVYTVVTGC